MSKSRKITGFAAVLSLAFLAVFGCRTSADKETVLAENGASSYAIIIGKNASLPEKFAAEELQKYIKKISGAVIPVKTDGNGSKNIVLIGTQQSNQLLASYLAKSDDFSEKEKKKDAFLITTKNGSLILCGSNPRSCLYAVYDFLEKELGVFWPTPMPEEEIVPFCKKICLNDISRKEAATFEYRGITRGGVPVIDWMAKHKMNWYLFGHFKEFEKDTDGFMLELKKRGMIISAAVHGTNEIMPPQKYFDKNPEYYSLNKEGKRVPDQLCTSNSDGLKIYTDLYLEFIAKNPDVDMFNVAQADGYGWCECPECNRIFGKERWEVIPAQLRASDRWLKAVNSVASEAEKKFPHKKIMYMPYVATGPCPKLAKPLPNVIAMLALYEVTASDVSSPDILRYHSCQDIHAYHRRLIEEWSKTASELLIYEYYGGRSQWDGKPMVLSQNMKNSLKYFASHGVKGLVTQAPYTWWRSYELNMYLTAELLWNVNTDTDKSIRVFCSRFYGAKAGAVMTEYFQNFEAYCTARGLYRTNKSAEEYLKKYGPDGFSICEHNLEEAQRLAETPEAVKQIQYQKALYGYNLLYDKMTDSYFKAEILCRKKDKDKACAMYKTLLDIQQETKKYLSDNKRFIQPLRPDRHIRLLQGLSSEYKWLDPQVQQPSSSDSPRKQFEDAGQK